MRAVKFRNDPQPAFVGAGVSSLGAPGLVAAAGHPLRAGQRLRLTGAPTSSSDIYVVTYAHDRLINNVFFDPAIGRRGAVISVTPEGNARLLRPGSPTLSATKITDVNASPAAPRLSVHRKGSTVTITVHAVGRRVDVGLNDRNRNNLRSRAVTVDGSRSITFDDVPATAASASAIIDAGHGYTSPETTVPIRGQ